MICTYHNCSCLLNYKPLVTRRFISCSKKPTAARIAAIWAFWFPKRSGKNTVKSVISKPCKARKTRCASSSLCRGVKSSRITSAMDLNLFLARKDAVTPPRILPAKGILIWVVFPGLPFIFWVDRQHTSITHFKNLCYLP